MAVFQNSSLQTTINTYSGMNFTNLNGFGYLVDTNTTYYVLDYFGSRIIMFNENWEYLSFRSLIYPLNMITVNNTLFISAKGYIYKTDKYLNIISQYYSASTAYRGLYLNSSSNTIYVAGQFNQTIYEFDLNLTFVDSFPTPAHSPWSIYGYKNYIYVGTYYSGYLLVMDNKVIIKTLPVCTATILSSIQLDNFGFMTLSCYNDKKAYLYYSENVSYTGINMVYAVNPNFINFDSHGRFVVISAYQIDIY